MFRYLALLVALSTFSEIRGCGYKPFGARVVNGHNALPHAWPWQVSLRLNSGYHFCGGTLIHPLWVVTASHCIDDIIHYSLYKVVAGAHALYGLTPYQQTIPVARHYLHKDYRGVNNDIALIKLAAPVRLSAQVNTACLPLHGSRAPTGSRCYITGWGRLVGGGMPANILQQAMLPVAGDKMCQLRNGHIFAVDSNQMICAGGIGRGGCHGDSGGPFVCQELGRWVLRGAVSCGDKFCRTNYYSVFARVSNYVNWINSKMNGGQ